jgi:hypothetical protein
MVASIFGSVRMDREDKLTTLMFCSRRARASLALAFGFASRHHFRDCSVFRFFPICDVCPCLLCRH